MLRLNKDATTAKLNLALFTTTLEDNKALAARVAHLEAELAGVSLSLGRKEEAFYALCAAAAAYRMLDGLLQAASCLERAASLGVGDSETQALLKLAIADTKLALYPPASQPPASQPPATKPVVSPTPKVEKAAPKVEEKAAPKAEEKAAPKAEEKAAPKAEEKASKKKKKKKKLP